MSGHTPSWGGWGTDSHSALQLCRILNLDASELAAWRKKGFRDFSLGRGSSCGATDIYLDNGWLLAVMAYMASLCTDSSLRNLAGAMPASVSNNNVGVGNKQPVTIRVLLFRVISNLLVCLLWHHAGAAYSAALYTIASAASTKIDTKTKSFAVPCFLLLGKILEKNRNFCKDHIQHYVVINYNFSHKHEKTVCVIPE